MPLLCVSERRREACPLAIEAVPLPPLREEQILAEMARRQPPIDRSTWPGIARWMAAQPAPYTLLEKPQDWPLA